MNLLRIFAKWQLQHGLHVWTWSALRPSMMLLAVRVSSSRLLFCSLGQLYLYHPLEIHEDDLSGLAGWRVPGLGGTPFM